MRTSKVYGGIITSFHFVQTLCRQSHQVHDCGDILCTEFTASEQSSLAISYNLPSAFPILFFEPC